jgi:hypothetical protein
MLIDHDTPPDSLSTFVGDRCFAPPELVIRLFPRGYKHPAPTEPNKLPRVLAMTPSLTVGLLPRPSISHIDYPTLH